jgi:hypothetical protein
VVIGGAGAGTNGTVDLASAEIFDPSTGAFTTASAVLTTAREGHQAFLLPKNNSVLVVGGTSSGTTVAASELFKPQVNSTSGAWTYAMAPTGSNVTPRSATTGSAMQQDGLLLAAGGTDASGNTLASTELYAFPTVKTDQSDYPPGTTVNITGTGFTPGETVTITLVESPLIDTHGPYTITADQSGNITDSSFTTDSHDLSVRFFLTATGSQSGLQPQNTFTDAVTVNTSVASSNNPSVVGQSVTFTATAIQNGNSNPVTCGKIQFKDNGSNLGSSLTLNGVSNQVTLSTTTLTQGSHSITAVYSGTTRCTTNNNGTDSALTQLVAGTPTKLAFLQQPSNAAAAQSISPPVTVQVEDSNGTLVNKSTALIAIAIANNPSGGALSGTTSVNAVNGVATFSSLSINKTGNGYTLSATSSGLTSATSNAFNITNGTATQLVFGTQPTSTTAGSSITPAMTIQVEDANGNLVTTGTGSTASITVAIATNPGGGTLSGTATVNAVSGVATFGDVVLEGILEFQPGWVVRPDLNPHGNGVEFDPLAVAEADCSGHVSRSLPLRFVALVPTDEPSTLVVGHLEPLSFIQDPLRADGPLG